MRKKRRVRRREDKKDEAERKDFGRINPEIAMYLSYSAVLV